jgi:DNA-binding LacI/PurR family transcriptional regulator
MKFRLLSHPEQVAAHLRSEIFRGRWQGALPGADRLGNELAVNHTTIDAAIRLLENEGLLRRQGVGKPRLIVLPKDVPTMPLRIALLLYERNDLRLDYIVELQHMLREAGHVTTTGPKSLTEMKMNLKQVAHQVGRMKADAWIIQSGSSEVLDWFSRQPAPAFAFAGRRRGVNIAGTGPDKLPAARAAVHRLYELGHRRMVMLTRTERRKPNPGQMETNFVQELRDLGITTGSYNLPDWDDTIEGLHQLLDSLFRVTPPTAIFVDEAPVYLAVELHLARLGFFSPADVSLLCLDPSPSFKWHRPSVAHILWESGPLIKQIVKWAEKVARGKNDRRQTFTQAQFIEGGTIGPAPQGRG